MENKTAVEWLMDEMSKGPVMPAQNWNYIKDLFQQALKLEKQQIIDAFSEGETNPRKMYYESGENYYSETYKKPNT